MEEWRQCGRWLIDCKVLPPNHRVVWPSAVVFDLAQALRDGVLLCQLLHNLSPGSIDLKDINFRPQMSQVGRGGGGSGFRGALCGVGAKVRGTRGWGGFVPMSASPPRLPHRGAQPLRGDNGNGLGGNPSPGKKETSPPYLHHPETKATNSAEGCVITFRALNESLIRL